MQTPFMKTNHIGIDGWSNGPTPKQTAHTGGHSPQKGKRKSVVKLGRGPLH